MSTATTYIQARVADLEQAIVHSVAEIDQADGSRVGLQQTLDSVRETLADIYGADLTGDVNEFLGIETVDEDDEIEIEDEDE